MGQDLPGLINRPRQRRAALIEGMESSSSEFTKIGGHMKTFLDHGRQRE